MINRAGGLPAGGSVGAKLSGRSLRDAAGRGYGSRGVALTGGALPGLPGVRIRMGGHFGLRPDWQIFPLARA